MSLFKMLLDGSEYEDDSEQKLIIKVQKAIDFAGGDLEVVRDDEAKITRVRITGSEMGDLNGAITQSHT